MISICGVKFNLCVPLWSYVRFVIIQNIFLILLVSLWKNWLLPLNVTFRKDLFSAWMRLDVRWTKTEECEGEQLHRQDVELQIKKMPYTWTASLFRKGKRDLGYVMRIEVGVFRVKQKPHYQTRRWSAILGQVFLKYNCVSYFDKYVILCSSISTNPDLFSSYPAV